MSAVLSLLIGLVVILVITAATAFFVAQEFAYMAVDRSRLGARAASGDAVAQRALSITKRTSFMLSGAQLGITVTGLLVGYVAEPLVGQAAGEMFGWAGVPTGTGILIGTVIALALSTVVQMVFGELVPKNLAISRPEPVARALSLPTVIYLRLTGWLVWIFDQSSNLLLKALGIEPVHDVEHSASARDLEHIVAESRRSGDLPDELSTLLDRIIDFPQRDVEHAMIPRSRVGVVHAEDTLGQVRELMATQHSRYPVLDDDEQILGVVHLVDVLTSTADDATPARDLARQAVIVPTVMMLPEAHEQLTSSGNKLACVVDEYGGLTGVLTLEDLAEEFVGEITDEHDPEPPPEAVEEDDGAWVLDGDVHVDEIERAIGHTLPDGDYETVSGLLIATHGALPEQGDVIVVPIEPQSVLESEHEQLALHVEVLELDRHVPSLLRLRLVPAPSDESLGRSADAQETE
ncbi:hemolysin family protein [Ornithinimicrobium murale]|uniref:hemolysin family protein n=1 Tax=Ornithinimicrobium murale TaxID=1050153 RepID=UPI000E0CFA8A|nr:hemolysin family protein [Ornithinimicrobium murale]